MGSVYLKGTTAFKRELVVSMEVAQTGVEPLVRALEKLAGEIHFRPGVKKTVMPVSFMTWPAIG